jgi:hypothetical protein
MTTHLVGLFAAAILGSGFGQSPDYSTPARALSTLESAYARKDLKGVLAAKDFHFEGREMLLAIAARNKWKEPPDEKMIAQAAEVLELAFQKEISSKGFPDMSTRRCKVVSEQAIRPDVARMVEECVHKDGSTSRETVHAVRSKGGWRIVMMPGT